MKISVNDTGTIVKEWLMTSVIPQMSSEDEAVKFIISFILGFKSKSFTNSISSKLVILANEDGILDIDEMANYAKTLLNNSFNGKLHVSKFGNFDLEKFKLAYDVDSKDIDDIVEIAKKYTR